MMRVRIDGGRADHRAAAGRSPTISTEFGRDTADVTDRQNIQLHWIRIEDVPEIWQRLEAVGLSTTEACGDTPRVILGCPLAGVAANEIIDGTPAIEETARAATSATRSSPTCPASSRPPSPAAPITARVHEINDVVVRRRARPRRHARLRPLGRRRAVHQSQAAPCGSASSCRREQLPEVWAGVTSIFRDYGYRRSRNRARLKFLVADWGPEQFREVLEKEYLGARCPTGRPPEQPRAKRRDHVGVHPAAGRPFAVGFAPRVGRVVRAAAAPASPTLADRHGSGRVRTTTEQKLIILGVTDVRPGSSPSSARSICRAPVVLPALHDGLHRASSSASSRSSRRRPAPSDLSTSSSSGCPTSTSRSGSTSTAARMRARASRSPTSV